MALMMIVSLLLLHQGYSLVSEITVPLGEPATLTCALPKRWLDVKSIYWYKQSSGDNLRLISVIWKNTNSTYGPGFSAKKLKTRCREKFCNLTIFKTVHDDEGIYHCAVIDWIENIWSGIYLSLKGNNQRTKNYTVVRQSAVSDPAGSGDSNNLQCSVLSDSENQTCSDLSVFWFKDVSQNSQPDIIYSDGNSRNGCQKRSGTQKKCVHHFSKSISSSEVGTYNCAVATCGEILYGDGPKLEPDQQPSSKFTLLMVVITCLTISVIVNVVFVCYGLLRAACDQTKGMEGTSLQERHDDLRQQRDDITESEPHLNYAALPFSKETRRKKTLKTECVYSEVKR
ncbi:uncharacterized protein ACNS7B_012036 [Menidia menidia]